MTGVMAFDDVGFGSGPNIFGEELYSLTLAHIYEECLGFKVYKVSPCVVGTREDVLCVKTRTIPILRGLYDVSLVHKLKSLIKELHEDIIHVNIVNPRYVNCFIELHNSRSNVI